MSSAEKLWRFVAQHHMAKGLTIEQNLMIWPGTKRNFSGVFPLPTPSLSWTNRKLLDASTFTLAQKLALTHKSISGHDPAYRIRT